MKMMDWARQRRPLVNTRCFLDGGGEYGVVEHLVYEEFDGILLYIGAPCEGWAAKDKVFGDGDPSTVAGYPVPLLESA